MEPSTDHLHSSAPTFRTSFRISISHAIQVLALCMLLSTGALSSADLTREEIAKLLGTPNRADIQQTDNKTLLQAEIDLGKKLFFDPMLSKDKSISCASCHNPNLGFGDGLASGLGVTGVSLPRNAPALYNLAWNTSFFWDGRAKSLEKQALGPIRAADEMGMKLTELSQRLRANSAYASAFKATYSDELISKKNIARALAQFERTIISDNSDFDKYLRGDDSAMSPMEKKRHAIICRQSEVHCLPYWAKFH